MWCFGHGVQKQRQTVLSVREPGAPRSLQSLVSYWPGLKHESESLSCGGDPRENLHGAIQSRLKILRLEVQEWFHGKAAIDIIDSGGEFAVGQLLLDGIKGSLDRGRVADIGGDAESRAAGFLDLIDDAVKVLSPARQQDSWVELGKTQGNGAA